MAYLSKLTCEETFRRLDDYLDRELPDMEMEQVREHLATCEWCAHEYRFEATLLEAVRTKINRIAVPSDLMGRISASLSREAERR